MKTILITGCSSGFGLEIARLFLERGWKVIATMRTPKEGILPASPNLRVIPLDVTDDESIKQAVELAGPIDVLVNNAGIGMASPVETSSLETMRDVFETNTFGTIAMTQAFLPQFRERRSGVIVNVTSSVTLKTLPLVSLYTASKAAVNAFTECLALEMKSFGVRACLVLPGRAPETPFAANGRDRMKGLDHEAYTELTKNLFASFSETGPITRSTDVAEAVWRTVNDPSCPLKLPAGEDAVAWANISKT